MGKISEGGQKVQIFSYEETSHRDVMYSMMTIAINNNNKLVLHV